MNTYREIVFIIQDILKNISDDKHFNENHLMYLANKHRSLQLFRVYKDAKTLPEGIMQTICVDLEKTFDCGNGSYRVKSTQEIPDVMDLNGSFINVYLPENPYNYRINYVSSQRFPFVNSSSYMKNIIYMTKNNDNKLELSANNNVDVKYLKKIQLKGVFEDPIQANKLSCNLQEAACDELDTKFYVDDKLIVIILQSIINDIAPALYRPIDISNNAKDDLSNSSIDAYLKNMRRQRPYYTSEE